MSVTFDRPEAQPAMGPALTTERVWAELAARGWLPARTVPEGNFLTYGLGVFLPDMAKPDAALARAPVT